MKNMKKLTHLGSSMNLKYGKKISIHKHKSKVLKAMDKKE